jgi:hypothetical protein
VYFTFYYVNRETSQPRFYDVFLPILAGPAINCVTQRVIEHFEKAKRGYGLTSIRKQKIGTWEKRMRQPGARVEDVAELEKILKRLIKLLDITQGTIFNSGKY